MQEVKVIGVTGGIGAGKSVICKVFSCLGVPCYDSDKAAKEIVNNNFDVKEQIIELLSEKAYFNGLYDSKFVSQLVFDNEVLLLGLNSIIHPAVKLDFNAWKQKVNSQIVVKETALLFSTKLWKEVDFSVLVFANEALRIKRILKRDPQRSIEQINRIFTLQGNQEELIEQADFVVYNDEQKSVLNQVEQILKKISI